MSWRHLDVLRTRLLLRCEVRRVRCQRNRSRRPRHAPIPTVFDRYSHLMPDSLEDLAPRMARMEAGGGRHAGTRATESAPARPEVGATKAHV
jgi:hypothetical protein